jgi:hypothetical protein
LQNFSKTERKKEHLDENREMSVNWDGKAPENRPVTFQILNPFFCIRNKDFLKEMFQKTVLPEVAIKLHAVISDFEHLVASCNEI